MNTPIRLGVFALGLVAVFGAALGAGNLAGPIAAAGEPQAGHGGGMSEDMGHGGHENAGGHTPGGLMISERGYRLSTVPARDGAFAFRVTGPKGRAVTAFDTEHDKRMHLIVVRRDLSGFRHVHPKMDPDGIWRVASPLDGPGTYRAFADFKPTGGPALTLGADVQVAGVVAPRPLPEPAATAEVDGYTVRLNGHLAASGSSRLTFTVTRNGRPVTDLRPYLGAYGHLVALRQGDLAYLHVHPDGAPGDGKTKPGPAVTFHAEAPSAGTYRLYLDFRHGGRVHTAEITAVAGAPGATGGHQDEHEHEGGS